MPRKSTLPGEGKRGRDRVLIAQDGAIVGMNGIEHAGALIFICCEVL